MPSIQARVRIVNPDKETLNDETGLVVKGSDIINQMRINNVWRNDKEGKYAGLMFDGQTYKFRIGQELIVPVQVARYLRRMSAICVGSDKLNGPLMPFVEIVETFDLMQPKVVEVKATPTTCAVCGVDQQTFPALMRHQMKEHADLFTEKRVAKPRTDWDAPSTSTDEVLDV